MARSRDREGRLFHAPRAPSRGSAFDPMPARDQALGRLEPMAPPGGRAVSLGCPCSAPRAASVFEDVVPGTRGQRQGLTPTHGPIVPYHMHDRPWLVDLRFFGLDVIDFTAASDLPPIMGPCIHNCLQNEPDVEVILPFKKPRDNVFDGRSEHSSEKGLKPRGCFYFSVDFYVGPPTNADLVWSIHMDEGSDSGFIFPDLSPDECLDLRVEVWIFVKKFGKDFAFVGMERLRANEACNGLVPVEVVGDGFSGGLGKSHGKSGAYVDLYRVCSNAHINGVPAPYSVSVRRHHVSDGGSGP